MLCPGNYSEAVAGAIAGLTLLASHLSENADSLSHVYALKTIALYIYVVISWAVFFFQFCCFRQRVNLDLYSMLARSEVS